MFPTRPQQHLLFDHDEVESKGVVLGHSGVSNLRVTVSSQKAFYSTAAMPPT